MFVVNSCATGIGYRQLYTNVGLGWVFFLFWQMAVEQKYLHDYIIAKNVRSENYQESLKTNNHNNISH